MFLAWDGDSRDTVDFGNPEAIYRCQESRIGDVRKNHLNLLEMGIELTGDSSPKKRGKQVRGGLLP